MELTLSRREQAEQTHESLLEANRAFDATGNMVAYYLAKAEQEEVWKEKKYDSINTYAVDVLKKSKGNVSILLTVGRMILESGFTPETISQPYYRLYLARGEKKNGFEAVVAHAETLSEQELVVKKKREDAGPHEPKWKKVCITCGLDEYNHETVSD